MSLRDAGVLMVTAAAIGFGVTYSDHAALIPLLGADLGLSDTQAGLLSASLFLAYIVVTLLTSGIPDRVGPKRAVAAGLTVSALGTALFAAGSTFGTLVAAKAVQGAGSALAFVAAARYIAGLYAGGQSHVGLGLYGGGFPLGSALALVVMPQLASITGSWRGAYVGEAAALATILAVWLAAPAVAARRPPGNMLDALRCTNCWLVSLQHAAGFGLAIAAGTWITVFLLREFSLPLALSGLLGSILLLLAVVGRPLGGMVVTGGLMRTLVVMRAGNLAVAAGVVLLALPGRPLPVALAGAIVLGLGVGLPYAAVFQTAAASLARAPGSAQGLAASGGTAGVLVGAPVMGFAVETWGFTAAWAFVGAVAALALAGTLFMQGEEELVRS